MSNESNGSSSRNICLALLLKVCFFPIIWEIKGVSLSIDNCSFGQLMHSFIFPGTLVPTHVAAAALEHLTTLVEDESIYRNISSIVALVAQLTSEIVMSHSVSNFFAF